MEIKSVIEALDKRGLVIRSSYLRENGQVIVEINGVPMTLFDQALRLAHGLCLCPTIWVLNLAAATEADSPLS